MDRPSMYVRTLDAENTDNTSQVGRQQIFVNDLIDRATEPAARMTVGFARVGVGEVLTSSFPYDEVLVLTSGSGYTVRTEDGEVHTVGAGDVVYLPAGSTNTFSATEHTRMAYVANPPSVYAEHVAAAAAAALSERPNS